MENFIHIGNSPQFKFARIGHVSEVIEVDDNFMECSKMEKMFILVQLKYLLETKGHSLEQLHESDCKAFEDLKDTMTEKEVVRLISKVVLSKPSRDGVKRVRLFFNKYMKNVQ